jgi:tRNA/rRNA methyltransferase
MKNNLTDNIDIILVGTLNSGNIGSAARAIKNMGLSRLSLVSPQCPLDDQAFWMAPHSHDIINNSNTYSSLREAISNSSYVFGTTARNRRSRNYLYPEEMAKKATAFAEQNKVSIIFGPEDAGLSNDNLELCNEVVSIPTAGDATSINISQAVMLICYEIFRIVNGNNKTAEEAELATARKVEAMYDHMRKALLEIGYSNPQNPDHVIGKFRRILSRAGLTAEDVKIIRGVFRQLLWYVKNRK